MAVVKDRATLNEKGVGANGGEPNSHVSTVVWQQKSPGNARAEDPN